MSSYGWTIEEVNNLTVPQMITLLEQIKEYPPTSMILIEFIRGLSKKMQTDKQENIDKALAKMGDKVVVSDSLNNEKIMYSKTGSIIKSIIRKKTGERII